MPRERKRAGQPPCGRAGGRGPGGGRYRRSLLEVSILSVLTDAPTHGYEMMEQLQALIGGLACVDAGTMYRTLRMMEEQGWVSSSWETPEAGPSRRVYTVTDTGLEALVALSRSLRDRAHALERLAEHAAQKAADTQALRNDQAR